MQPKLFLILAFNFLLVRTGAGQGMEVVRTDSTAKIDGQIYLIHKVQPKQTLFSIAKAYEVNLSRITFDNPGVLDGLKLDQPLRILKSAIGETSEAVKVNDGLQLDGEYVLYTVPAKQTMYSIATDYNTSVSAILDANPELANGLKVGMTIRIPTPKILDGKTTEKEKMVGLPDMVKKDVLILKHEAPSTEGGRIALLLPLYLDLNDTTGAKRMPGQPEQIYERSEMALQFYEGFLMALDTLQAMGYEVDVKVIDTENRPWKVKQLVDKGVLNDMDLIIGPFYSKEMAELSQFVRMTCIPMVSPTIKGNSILENPYVFKMIPSDETLIYDLGRYVAQSDSTRNMILHYGSTEEQKMLWRFRLGLEANGMRPADFPAYDLAKMGTDSVRNKLSLTKRNNLIVLSNNQVRLSGLVRRLSDWSEDAYIVTYAPNSWLGFKNIEVHHFDELRMHMPVPFHVDYGNVEVQQFVLKFREKFKGEPSSFAFRGYDIAMHFIRNLGGIISDGPEYMETVDESGFQSAFRWKRQPDGGFENTRSRMVDYTGLQLKLATD